MTMKCSQPKLSLVVVAAAFFATATAGAVEVSIIGATSATITEGGAFTIDLGLDNASLDNTPGFEGILSGLAAAGVDVTSGQAATSFLNEFCFPGQGCFLGVNWIGAAFWNPHDLAANFNPGDDSLLAINVAGATFSSQSGAVDLGLANDIANATPSAIDSTIHLIATVVGVHELTIGGEWSDGVDVFPLAPSTFTLTVLPIPEPGTALLMGIGLAVLATAGWRRKEDRWR
ncbi:hypothetical protein DRQ32_10320 [bacterium]|nr:MAG: hypothetical protein DRQ32_10320 [bacterium]